MVAAPNAAAEGQTLREWAADWAQWAYGQPEHESALLDPTGALCANDQEGNVWFLAGNFGGTTTRTCTIPHGRALFFPVLLRSYVFSRRDRARGPQVILESHRRVLRDARLTATIDGSPVRYLRRHYVESTVYVASLPRDNVFDHDAADCAIDWRGLLACAPSLDAGYYVFVKPLPRGKHRIHFTARVPDKRFELDVTYDLIVK